MYTTSCWLLMSDVCEQLGWTETHVLTVAAVLVAADKVYITACWLRVEPVTGNGLVAGMPRARHEAVLSLLRACAAPGKPWVPLAVIEDVARRLWRWSSLSFGHRPRIGFLKNGFRARGTPYAGNPDPGNPVRGTRAGNPVPGEHRMWGAPYGEPVRGTPYGEPVPGEPRIRGTRLRGTPYGEPVRGTPYGEPVPGEPRIRGTRLRGTRTRGTPYGEPRTGNPVPGEPVLCQK